MEPVRPREPGRSSANLQRRRASVVCVDAGELLCVQLRDPLSRIVRLFVPGGAVEAGESPARTAARETREETGYDVAVDESSERVTRYAFTWAGRDVDCTTHFFRAALLTPRGAPYPAQVEAIHEGVVWLPLERLPEALGFHAEIFTAVRALAGR